MAGRPSHSPAPRPPQGPSKRGLVRSILATPRLAVPLLLSSLFLVAMMALTIWGERGVLAVWDRQQEIAALARQLEAVDRENARLVAEIERLRSDLGYIEKIAREELGLVRPGELVFEFVE